MTESKKISLTKTIRKDGQDGPRAPSLSANVGKSGTASNGTKGRLTSTTQGSPVGSPSQADIPPLPSTGSSYKDTAAWLTATLGEEPFAALKESPYFRIPLVEKDASTTQWLAVALKTLFSEEDMALMAERLSQNVLGRMAALELEADSAMQEKSNALSAKKAMAGKMRSSIPLNDLVDQFIGRGMEQMGVRKLLSASMENPTDGLPDFVIGLCKGWPAFRASLDSREGNEQIRLDSIHEAMTGLLAAISDKRIPERRAILEEVCKLASERFEDFDFVSPEETRQVDPRLHNAAGLGGTTIAEGISFAVVRTSNRQTVKFADVKVSP